VSPCGIFLQILYYVLGFKSQFIMPRLVLSEMTLASVLGRFLGWCKEAVAIS
jgi:hypothetical protein